jgi:sugar O-acyltransferase (sialic acid O-acetyltransferase NeuD family)
MEFNGIVLIGGGGHCKSCIEVIDAMGLYSIKGILDLPENIGKYVLSYPIIGTDQDIPNLIKRNNSFLITVGNTGDSTKRFDLYNYVLSLDGILPFICAPTAYVSKSAHIGKGTIIMHHAFVNASAVIGDNCIINTKAIVEHDAVIGAHCHISTGSIVNGGTKIGARSFFGSGAVSKQNTIVPEGSFIKANSVVK